LPLTLHQLTFLHPLMMHLPTTMEITEITETMETMEIMEITETMVMKIGIQLPMTMEMDMIAWPHTPMTRQQSTQATAANQNTQAAASMRMEWPSA
jgi:hypothetical protein